MLLKPKGSLLERPTGLPLCVVNEDVTECRLGYTHSYTNCRASPGSTLNIAPFSKFKLNLALKQAIFSVDSRLVDTQQTSKVYSEELNH